MPENQLAGSTSYSPASPESLYSSLVETYYPLSTTKLLDLNFLFIIHFGYEYGFASLVLRIYHHFAHTSIHIVINMEMEIVVWLVLILEASFQRIAAVVSFKQLLIDRNFSDSDWFSVVSYWNLLLIEHICRDQGFWMKQLHRNIFGLAAIRNLKQTFWFFYHQLIRFHTPTLKFWSSLVIKATFVFYRGSGSRHASRIFHSNCIFISERFWR